MRKIEYYLDIGYAGCQDEGQLEIDDTMTELEINEMVHDMAMEWAQSWEGDERLGEDWNEEGATEQFYENVCGSWKFVTDED